MLCVNDCQLFWNHGGRWNREQREIRCHACETETKSAEAATAAAAAAHKRSTEVNSRIDLSSDCVAVATVELYRFAHDEALYSVGTTRRAAKSCSGPPVPDDQSFHMLYRTGFDMQHGDDTHARISHESPG